MAPRLRPLLAAVPYAALAAAYSFNFKNTPRQCQNLEIGITGSGKPPYSVLIIPFGPTPLPNSIEARRITDVSFNGTESSVSFQLKFPENSQFVAVVSDSTGFGTGGTSAVVTVLSGEDGCFDPNTTVQPPFLFHTTPDHLLITCTASRIWWDNSTVQGVPTFQGVIPGGQSFSIPEGPLSDIVGQGTGFSWSPPVRVGTVLLLVGGDDRGFGTGGSNTYTMQDGNVYSCLNNTSPSSTPGSPAGGSYPTSTDGSGVNLGGGGGSHVDVGAIVGGVIGGVVGAIALALVILFAVRRQRYKQGTKERPVDLLQDQDNDGPSDGRPPEYYQPEPFVLPDPTVVSSTHESSVAGTAPYAAGLATRASTDHRQSYLSTSTSETGLTGLRPPASSAPSTSTRKSPMPPSFRPVNIIQHDDAGPSEPPPPPDDEPETIELPPAYTNIRRDAPRPSQEGEQGEGAAGSAGATTQAVTAAQA
ncbi:hypothetical protein C8Q73DRAFT_663041 [Cubamyces lactineus]|nr:hypothetical protein C8Q73DRAFT_663041 [Cubamyces lactineus]